MAEHTPAAAGGITETANDRLKNRFGNWFWGSVMVATVLHFMMFAFWPEMSAADYALTTQEFEAIDLPPEIEIPPPPQQIARPATPVVSAANIDEDITIAATTFEDNPIEMLPAPPTATTSDDISAAPTFTPFTVEPRLKNQDEVQRALQRNYPPLLRDAGIGGKATVWFFIDENGKVVKTQLNASSGYTALDEAAVAVANLMQFTPALNRDKKVQVWVSIPIAFTSK